jgi:hypothetical protein
MFLPLSVCLSDEPHDKARQGVLYLGSAVRRTVCSTLECEVFDWEPYTLPLQTSPRGINRGIIIQTQVIQYKDHNTIRAHTICETKRVHGTHVRFNIQQSESSARTQ